VCAGGVAEAGSADEAVRVGGAAAAGGVDEAVRVGTDAEDADDVGAAFDGTAWVV